MTHASIPSRYWDDIFTSIVYLINRQPSTCDSSSSFFKLFHKQLDYSLLRVLGCLCFPYTRSYNNHKLEPRSKPCAFLGYPISQKGYKCLHIESNKICVSRHVVFDEFQFPFKNKSSGAASDSVTLPNLSNWLPLLAQPAASCVIQHPGHHSTSTEDLEFAQQPIQHTSPLFIPSLPLSNTSNQMSDLSTSAADPQPTLNSTLPLFIGSIPISSPPYTRDNPSAPLSSSQPKLSADPSHPAADPVPLKTYSSRAKAVAIQEPSVTTREQTFLPVTPSLAKPSSSQLVTTTSSHPMVTKRRKFNTNHALLTESFLDTEPKTYNQVKLHSHWIEAMTKEHNALLANKIWILVPPSPDQNVVGCR